MIAIDWETILPPWLGEALPLGMMLTDAALRVRYWGPWLAERSGLPAAHAIGRPLGALFADLESRGLAGHYERALAGETVTLRQRDFGYLLPLPAPENSAGLSHMQQRAVIAPLRVEGRVAGTLTVIADLTERAAQDMLLQQLLGQQDETLALLDTLITKAPIGFALIDEELRFRGINERLAELNGLPVAEHLGRSIFEVTPGLADQQLPRFLRVIETGAPVINAELRGETRARPGEAQAWQVSYYPVFASDKRRLGVGLLVTDVTEQRRAEERERFMARLSGAMTASLDEQATLESLARAMVPYLADWCVIDMAHGGPGGRRSAVAHSDPVKEAVARELQRRFPRDLGAEPLGATALDECRALLIPRVEPAPPAPGGEDPDRLRLLEQLRPTSTMLVPLHVGGAGIGVLSLTRGAGSPPYGEDDLALAEEAARRMTVAIENARLFAAAERSRAVAEEAVQLRDAFFSIAAHELRTPLTTLLGRAQLLNKWLAQDASSQRSRRSMQIVVDQAQRLDRMITALLDVSRIRAGRFAIEPRPMDLASLVRRVVDETRPTLSGHTLELSEPGAPIVVRGDEVRLEQVVQNLLSNAVKYSPGGGRVRVEAEAGDGEARLTVRDEGIGIPDAARDRLFKRFYRADNAEQQGISGLGIGLFLIGEIVELHGGSISVASAEGEGSAFTVRLPLAG